MFYYLKKILLAFSLNACVGFCYSRHLFFLHKSLQIRNSLLQSSSQTSDLSESNCFVIIQNIQSKNIGAICRNCVAFNIKEVIFVGLENIDILNTRAVRRASAGSLVRKQGIHSKVPSRNVNSLVDAVTYLRSTYSNCSIIGVEIIEGAIPFYSQPFSSNTAFIFGNEGDGLSDEQMDLCDKFVYIPQYNKVGIASINVASASAIILQSFAMWASFEETRSYGGKFIPVSET